MKVGCDIVNGRWIDYGFFNSHNFEYSSKLDNLGWTSMTIIRDDVFPDLVAYFYANASRECGTDSINSYVKCVSITLNKAVIRKILGMGHGGEKYRDKVKRKEELKVLYGEDVDECVQI